MRQPITLTTFFHFHPGGLDRLREYQNHVEEAFLRHRLRIKKEILVSGRGQIGKDPNTRDQPDLIQIASIDSLEDFQAYLQDPLVQRWAPHRQEGLRKMTAHLGPSMDLELILPSPPAGSIHVAALVRFKEPLGLESLVEFNRKGIRSGLFPRWGIHVGHLAKIDRSMAAIGTLDGPNPQALVHFAIEEPSRMGGYLSDPEYQTLAPLRDQALESYHFFQGA